VACDRCLRRSWLLNRLGGHLEHARGRIEDVLALGDDQLIAAVGGRRGEEIRDQLAAVDPHGLRRGAHAGGLEHVCRCDPAYPRALSALRSPPATLYVAGGLERFLALIEVDPVAIVGARRPSPYGLEVASSLARGAAVAGVTVISGMALGVDSAAHAGALAADRPTVAVLPGCAAHPYPASLRALHAHITASGASVSEMGPGARVWRWSLPARNRIIAALAAMTVVVEAGERSGALLTAAFAREAGRVVGAVPGRVSAPQAAGPNALLGAGARVIRGPQDVLDALFGAGARLAQERQRPPLEDDGTRALLEAMAAGHDGADALARAGLAADRGLAALAALELGGYIRREPGGRFVVLP